MTKMTMKSYSVGLAFAASVAVGLVAGMPGCGSDSCKVASEGCDCTSGGACDPGLQCLSKKCVRTGGGAGGSGGASSSGSDGAAAGGSGGAVASVDWAKVCGEFGQKVCERYNACAPAFVKIGYGEPSKCAERIALDCLEGSRAMDSGVTKAGADACLAAIPGFSCDDILYRKTPACDFKGKRINGGVCGTGDQCQSGRCSRNDQVCGTCGPYLQAGVRCVEDDDCEPGMECSEDNRCVLPSAGGTACSATQPCRYGYYCRNGTCAATVKEAGANCEDALHCSLPHGLYCNLAARRCQSIGLAAAGSPCGVSQTGVVLCLAGSCRAGVCESTARDGEPCGAAAMNRGCLSPAVCVNGSCRLPNPSSCN